MTRLGRLRQPARALLVAGAMLGTHFTFEQVCHVAELPEREALEGLDEAVRAHLLREDAMGGYTFSYDMLRAVVSAQAGAARRQDFWRRARALMTDGVCTAPWSDEGVTGDAVPSPIGTDAGGPFARGGQVARARFSEDRASAARGLARSPFPAALSPPGNRCSRLLMACEISDTPIRHRVSSMGARTAIIFGEGKDERGCTGRGSEQAWRSLGSCSYPHPACLLQRWQRPPQGRDSCKQNHMSSSCLEHLPMDPAGAG